MGALIPSYISMNGSKFLSKNRHVITTKHIGGSKVMRQKKIASFRNVNVLLTQRAPLLLVRGTTRVRGPTRDGSYECELSDLIFNKPGG